MLNNIDDFLTVDEACDIMKIGHNAIYSLLRSGNLKAFRGVSKILCKPIKWA